eukprot:3218103-Alexandrium_andersonii.AAC.1
MPPRVPGGDCEAAIAGGEHSRQGRQRRALPRGRRPDHEPQDEADDQLLRDRRCLHPGHAHGSGASGEGERG